MQAIVIAGVVLAVGGLVGVLWCLASAAKIRRGEVDEATAKAMLNRMVAVNMASIGAAFFGFALLVAGLILS